MKPPRTDVPQASATDLTKYLHGIWLHPSPSLISPASRRRALKPAYTLPDGKSQVGAGWEINLRTANTSSNASESATKTYSIYGKSGGGGGWRSWIDVVPNLGYGLVILSQSAGIHGHEALYPAGMYGGIHDVLLPAFAEALAADVQDRFAGTYANARDTGLFADTVRTESANASASTSTYARLEVHNQILCMRDLVVNGSSALEAIDRLGWVDDSIGPRYSSRPGVGVVLEAAGGESETGEFAGDGNTAQVFRMTGPGEEVCNWYDYDG